MIKIKRFVTSAVLLSLGSWAARAQAAPQVKEWTFLVFINGNNSLDSFGTSNLKQMERVGSTDKVNVVAQWASQASGKTQRLLVKQDPTGSQSVTSPILQDMGAVDMGDWNSLVEFIKWGVAQYPAKHYFIDVWDHGSGWRGSSVGPQMRIAQSRLAPRAAFHPSDISFDEGTGHSITTAQLAQAMAAAAQVIGHKVDVYGSDACLMGMAEVAYQMRNSVSYYVGSQEVEPGEGWPYDKILTDWNALPNMTAEAVSSVIPNDYRDAYLTNGEFGEQEVTFASYDLSKAAQLSSAVHDLSVELLKLPAASKAKVLTATQASQSFTFADYKDLSDVGVNLAQAKLSTLVPTLVASVQLSLQSFVKVNAVTSTYAKAKGLSIWLPDDAQTLTSYSDLYKTLDFNVDTRWGDTLNFILQ